MPVQILILGSLPRSVGFIAQLFDSYGLTYKSVVKYTITNQSVNTVGAQNKHKNPIRGTETERQVCLGGSVGTEPHLAGFLELSR
jgi:hypothetical protein